MHRTVVENTINVRKSLAQREGVDLSKLRAVTEPNEHGLIRPTA